MIKPIETRYKGYRFRSRLEARWAVLMDALHVKWEYEPQGYVVRGTPYLPDFWLPKHRLWLEVKGQEPTPDERAVCRSLNYESKSGVLLAHGLPTRESFPTLFCNDLCDSGGGEWEQEAIPFALTHPAARAADLITDYETAMLLVCGMREDRVIFPVFDERLDCYLVFDMYHNTLSGHLDPLPPGFRQTVLAGLERAIDAARGARFEHGESP